MNTPRQIDDHEQLERRRAQNRLAQKRYRERHHPKPRASSTASSRDGSQLPFQPPGVSFVGALLSPTSQASSALTPSFASDAFAERSPSHNYASLLDDVALAADVGSLNSLGASSPATTDMFQSPAPASDGAPGANSSKTAAHPAPSSSPSPSQAVIWVGPLHMAAQKGSITIARILLQYNTDCNEEDSEGLTPLAHAVIGGHQEVLNLFLSHGARTDIVDCKGRSAFPWAVIHRREAILKILLTHRPAGQTAFDNYAMDGRTPLHMAVDGDFDMGVQILLQYGASVHKKARRT